MTARRRPEQNLQRAVLNHLRWRGGPGLFVFHPANGGWRTATEAAIFKGLGVVAGVPGLIVVQGGKVFALELKPLGGKLTATQSATHERMRDAGAIVATAHGIDAARSAHEWDLLRKWSGPAGDGGAELG